MFKLYVKKYHLRHLLLNLFFFNFGGHQPYLWDTDTPVLDPGDVYARIQSYGGSLACVRHHLSAIHSSNLPMVQHLLTSWEPAWQPGHFLIHILAHVIQALVGLESGIERTSATQCVTDRLLNL